MKQPHQEQFFQLLRLSMGVTELSTFEATAEDWQWLHKEAARQGLTGVIYGAVAQLPADQQPPMDLFIQWMCEADVIKGLNELLYQESARLTKLFGDAGRRTAILKGQANARLYPDRFSRGPGDIDIWVEGGRKSVLALLQTDAFALLTDDNKLVPIYHHVALHAHEKKVSVEVHYRPASGNRNPFTNRRLQRWLEQEILHTTAVPEGFNVPSVRFALVMQLSHVQRHFLREGIDLRRICDYYWLLRNSTEEDRQVVAERLKSFGLRPSAGALMWILGEKLQLDRGQMLCEPDSYRGEWMLREIMPDSNTGHHARRRHQGLWRRVFTRTLRSLRMMPFNFGEVFWGEVNFCKGVIQTLPERIRRRSISLGEANKRDAKKLASTKKIS